MDNIKIGMIGSGFAAHLHAEALKFVTGNPKLYGVASIGDNLQEFANQYGITKTYTSYKEMLQDPEVDVVDIIVPPASHKQCIIDALNAGKHVICEKPLTGYFGQEGDIAPIGNTVCRQKMYDAVIAEMDEISQVLKQSNKIFCYAENWVYAPGVQKAAEIIDKKRLKQFLLRGEESHAGSHAAHAAHFNLNGGGSLIRQGCHPISAVLYLKGIEAQAHNQEIYPTSVICDVGALTSHLPEQDKTFVASRPIDVEDYAQCIITFSDGSKADILSADLLLGGVKNRLEIYSNEATINCNISPNNGMETYFASETGLEDVHLTEKAQTKLGWQNVFLTESISRGYAGELQDFIHAIANNKQPLSGFKLAYDTTKVVYGAYVAAATGKRFHFDN